MDGMIPGRTSDYEHDVPAPIVLPAGTLTKVEPDGTYCVVMRAGLSQQQATKVIEAFAEKTGGATLVIIDIG